MSIILCGLGGGEIITGGLGDIIIQVAGAAAGSGGRGPRRWYDKYLKKKKEPRLIRIRIKSSDEDKWHELTIEETDIDDANIYIKESEILTKRVMIYIKERLKKEQNFEFRIREIDETKSK